MAKQSAVSTWKAKPKRKRKGIHAKTKRSIHKHSKNYKKAYNGQGK